MTFISLKKHKRQVGGVLVEMSLVTPFLLSLVFLIIDVALVMTSAAVIDSAVYNAGLAAARATYETESECMDYTLGILDQEMTRGVILSRWLDHSPTITYQTSILIDGDEIPVNQRFVRMSVNAVVPCTFFCRFLLQSLGTSDEDPNFNYIRAVSFMLENQERCL